MDLSRIPPRYLDQAKQEVFEGRYFITFYDPSKSAYRYIRKTSKRYGAKLEETGAGHTRLVLDFVRHRHYFGRIVRAIKKNPLIKKTYVSEDLKDYIEFGYKNFVIRLLRDILDEEREKKRKSS